MCNGIGVVVRALPGVTALLTEKEETQFEVDKESSGFPQVLVCLARPRLSCRRVARHHGLTPWRGFALPKTDKFHNSGEAENRGMKHDPDFIAKLGTQRDELVRSLLFIGASRPEPSPAGSGWAWCFIAISGDDPGSSHRSASAAATKWVQQLDCCRGTRAARMRAEYPGHG